MPSHAYERLRRRHRPATQAASFVVDRADDLQNTISSLDPKTAAYKDHLLAVALCVPHGFDFST